jgi:uncharacterized protein YneF (UPF0154 family)
MKNWKAILGVLLVFLLGMMAGGLLAAKLIQHRAQKVARGGPAAVEEVVVRRLGFRLGLDAAQREQVRQIIRQSQLEMRPVRQQGEEVAGRAAGKVREILRPDQREKFDRLLAERRRRWQP